jgi:hypothetical protein
MRGELMILVALAGCSAIDDHPSAEGDPGPPPGISYRIHGEDTSHVYSQAADYCKSHGDKTAKLDKLSDPQGAERVAEFSCN